MDSILSKENEDIEIPQFETPHKGFDLFNPETEEERQGEMIQENFTPGILNSILDGCDKIQFATPKKSNFCQIYCSNDGTIIEASENCSEIFGTDRESLVGQNYFDQLANYSKSAL